jgi:hypothetical protein
MFNRALPGNYEPPQEDVTAAGIPGTLFPLIPTPGGMLLGNFTFGIELGFLSAAGLLGLGSGAVCSFSCDTTASEVLALACAGMLGTESGFALGCNAVCSFSSDAPSEAEALTCSGIVGMLGIERENEDSASRGADGAAFGLGFPLADSNIESTSCKTCFRSLSQSLSPQLEKLRAADAIAASTTP